MPRKRTALVVDDEEVDRLRASNALSAEGYRVLQSESYSDAMAVFDMNRNTITFLVADVSLPDGNGCALASAMRNQKADLRVLFVSGHVGAEVTKYYGLEAGALHFLMKPFEAQELKDRARKILKSRQGFPRLYVPKTLTSSSG
jgi:two-component system cell cycle sensor histidine kinase/response regulator CckA